jgi:hypothetical protein
MTTSRQNVSREAFHFIRGSSFFNLAGALSRQELSTIPKQRLPVVKQAHDPINLAREEEAIAALALPNDNKMPSHFPQFSVIPTISLSILV